MLRFFLTAVLLSTDLASAGDHWPQWRGPTLNGVSDATDLAETWSAADGTHIAWRIDLPGWSGGTPVVWGDSIFVTSPSSKAAPAGEAAADGGGAAEVEAAETPPNAEGRRRRGGRGRGGRGGGAGGRDPGGDDLLLLCFDAQNGAERWRQTLDTGNALYRKGNNCSPSPVTDGTHVWCVTGTGAVTALDMNGQVAWTTNLQATYGSFGLNWGYASSPLLHEGMLIVPVLHGMRTDDPSYIVAFEAATGAVNWRVERPTDAPRESPDAYTTPTVSVRGDTTEIIVTGGDYVTGHDPTTGVETWRLGGLNPRKASNYRIVASPIAIDGMVYAPTRVRPLLALEPGSAAPVVWRWDDRGAPDVPTPACDGRRFYMVDDQGMATCLDAKTGAVLWGPERTVNGTVSASPLLADGRLYIVNEEGVTAVLRAGDAFEMLATNELDGSYTLSSPITAGGAIFIRTGTKLYRIEK